MDQVEELAAVQTYVDDQKNIRPSSIKLDKMRQTIEMKSISGLFSTAASGRGRKG